jgi:hypothetical protein
VRRLSRLLAAIVLAAAGGAGPASAQPLPPQIHTVAGGGSCSGPGGEPVALAEASGGPCDGISATSAAIGLASSVAALPGGGYLFVDSANDLVREVVPSGKVITVAGNGTPVDAPDGTVAVDSGLAGPVAVAPLPDGSFLVTEYGTQIPVNGVPVEVGSVVRVVSPGPPGTATITTIAGVGTPGKGAQSGPATGNGAIPLDYPTDAEPLADGRVLIVDSGAGYIRVLSAAAPGASISTIAGGGSCDDRKTTCEGMAANKVALHDPVSVSPIQGGAGGYLLAEDDYTGANAVRQISQVSTAGTFTTVAGVPGQTGGYGGDGGPATAALLNTPAQVLSMPDGSFMIADTDNEAIREVSPTGTITTVAGDEVVSNAGDGGAATAASVNQPTAVAPTPDGGFLIAANSLVRQVTIPPTTTISLTPSAPTGLNGWYTAPVHVTTSAPNSSGTSCYLDPTFTPMVFQELYPSCPYRGKGANVTTDGQHTLYVASTNPLGDMEEPVSLSFKVDITPPVAKCSPTPTFALGSYSAVSATLSDQISGPSSLLIFALADTSAAGRFFASVTGENSAGVTTTVLCPYTVLAAQFTPAPKLGWAFAVSAKKKTTTVRRLVVSGVPAGAAVNLTCTGGGCPFKTARGVTGKECGGKPCLATPGAPAGRQGAVALAPLFAGVKLSAGAQLAVSVTAPSTVGLGWRFTFHPGGQPTMQAGCLQPGSLSAADAGCKQ